MDIVDRLRGMGWRMTEARRNEAADEIERLRKIIDDAARQFVALGFPEHNDKR